MRENTNAFFKGKVRKCKYIIKQLLNSVLIGNEELLRPRFVLSASAFGFGRLHEPHSIIVYSTARFLLCKVLRNYRTKQKIQPEMSHQQNVGAQKYKRTCITVSKVFSYNTIKIFVSLGYYQPFAFVN